MTTANKFEIGDVVKLKPENIRVWNEVDSIFSSAVPYRVNPYVMFPKRSEINSLFIIYGQENKTRKWKVMNVEKGTTYIFPKEFLQSLDDVD